MGERIWLQGGKIGKDDEKKIGGKDENKVDRALRRAFFEDLEEMGPTYRLESRKPRVVIKRPFQVGIAVYQLAK